MAYFFPLSLPIHYNAPPGFNQDKPSQVTPLINFEGKIWLKDLSNTPPVLSFIPLAPSSGPTFLLEEKQQNLDTQSSAPKPRIDFDQLRIDFEEKAYNDCILNSSNDGTDRWTDKYAGKWINAEVGYGLFARQAYKKNEVIGVYAGKLILSHNVIDKEYAFDWFDNAFHGLSTDAQKESNAMRFINHASRKRANVDTIEYFYRGLPYLTFVANCPIAEEKQLLCYYGSDYWKNKGVKPLVL
jgi:hypothetical protein